MKALHVRYFALFREQAGRSAETVEVDARTPAELFELLCEQRGLSRGLPNMKVAINDEMAELDTALRDGDTVLFFPPVAGG